MSTSKYKESIVKILSELQANPNHDHHTLLVYMLNYLALWSPEDGPTLTSLLVHSLTGLLQSYRLNSTAEQAEVRASQLSSRQTDWQKILQLVRIMSSCPIQIYEADLLKAVISTAAIKEQICDSDLESLLGCCDSFEDNQIKEPHLDRRLKQDQLNLFFPLSKMSEGPEPGDIYALNSIAIRLKTCPQNIQQNEILETFERPGLAEVNYLAVQLSSVLDKIRGQTKGLEKKLKHLLRRPDLPKSLQIEALLLTGFVCCDIGSLNKGLVNFLKVLKLDSGNIHAMIGARKIFSRQGNFRAERDLLKLIIDRLQIASKAKESGYLAFILNLVTPRELEPSLPECQRLLGLAQLKLKDFDGAADSFLAGLSQSGASWEISNELRILSTTCLIQSARVEEASGIAEYLEKVIPRKRFRCDNNYSLVCSIINARVKACQEDYKRALYFIDRALNWLGPSLNPDRTAKFPRLDNSAQELLVNRTGNNKCEDLRRPLRLRSRLYVLKSSVYQDMGDNKSYLECLSTALTLHPTPSLISAYKRDTKPLAASDCPLARRLQQQGLERVEQHLKEVSMSKKTTEQEAGDQDAEEDPMELCLDLLLPGADENLNDLTS